MKRKSATAFLFLLAVTSITANDLRTLPSDKNQETDQKHTDKQQGYMTPDGVYVPPSRPASAVDLDKFMPRRTSSPE